MGLRASSLLWIGLVACNSIAGYGDFQKVGEPSTTTTPKKDAGGGGGVGGPGLRDGGGGGGDGGTQTPTGCDITQPFDAPIPVPGGVNSQAHDTTPSLTGDELTIVFQRTTGIDGGDLLLATRATREEPFGAARALDELSTSGISYDPTITSDGLNIYWTELNRANGPQTNDIFTADRPTASSRFVRPREEFIVNTANKEEYNPFISANGKELWVFSGVAGVVPELFRSIQGGDNEFAERLKMPIASVGSRFWMNETSTAVYYAASGGTTPEHSDLFVIRRPDVSAVWGTREPLTPLNSATNEGSPWLTKDECTIYFATARNGKDDIFMAKRKGR